MYHESHHDNHSRVCIKNVPNTQKLQTPIYQYRYTLIKYNIRYYNIYLAKIKLRVGIYHVYIIQSLMRIKVNSNSSIVLNN